MRIPFADYATTVTEVVFSSAQAGGSDGSEVKGVMFYNSDTSADTIYVNFGEKIDGTADDGDLTAGWRKVAPGGYTSYVASGTMPSVQKITVTFSGGSGNAEVSCEAVSL